MISYNFIEDDLLYLEELTKETNDNLDTYNFNVTWSRNQNTWVSSCQDFPGIIGIGDNKSECLISIKIKIAQRLVKNQFLKNCCKVRANKV